MGQTETSCKGRRINWDRLKLHVSVRSRIHRHTPTHNWSNPTIERTLVPTHTTAHTHTCTHAHAHAHTCAYTHARAPWWRRLERRCHHWATLAPPLDPWRRKPVCVRVRVPLNPVAIPSDACKSLDFASMLCLYD